MRLNSVGVRVDGKKAEPYLPNVRNLDLIDEHHFIVPVSV